MARISVYAVVVCGILLLGCGGDRNAPSESPTSLSLAGSACKSADFVTAIGMYSSAANRRDMESRCKDTLAAVSKGKHAEAGLIMYGILAKLWGDWSAQNFGATGPPLTALTSAPFSGDFEASLLFFIEETCQLDTAVPCHIPNYVHGWYAGGPLNNGATGAAPHDSFAFRCNTCTDAFVYVAARPDTTDPGPCPGSSENNGVDSLPHDCENDIYDFHAFPEGSVSEWTAASCSEFGELHMRCPNGQCVFGESTVDAALVALLSCEEEVSLREWRGLVYHATRPVQWFMHATPAVAAGGAATTFDGTSPIVLADVDTRLREVVCSVSSGYNSGSEGTICELRQGTTVVESCVTVATSSSTAECSMFPVVPDAGVTLTPRAFKTGSGAFVQVGTAFTLEPDSPGPGQSITVTFNLAPPGQQ